jgi:hypothetical protein
VVFIVGLELSHPRQGAQVCQRLPQKAGKFICGEGIRPRRKLVDPCQVSRRCEDASVRQNALLLAAAATPTATASTLGLGDFSNLDTPNFRAALQGVPAELTGSTNLKLAVQGLGVVVVNQLQGLTRQQSFEGAENQGMALGWRDLAEVKGTGRGDGHGKAFKDVLLMPVYFNRTSPWKK